MQAMATPAALDAHAKRSPVRQYLVWDFHEVGQEIVLNKFDEFVGKITFDWGPWKDMTTKWRPYVRAQFNWVQTGSR
jgi:hypothetical protein